VTLTVAILGSSLTNATGASGVLPYRLRRFFSFAVRLENENSKKRQSNPSPEWPVNAQKCPSTSFSANFRLSMRGAAKTSQKKTRCKLEFSEFDSGLLTMNSTAQEYCQKPQRKSKRLKFSRNCAVCNSPFNPGHKKQKTCSLKCGQRLNGQLRSGRMDREKCAACHAIIGMDGVSSGRLLNWHRATVCKFRKKNGYKTLSNKEARLAHLRLSGKTDLKIIAELCKNEWKGVVDCYWQTIKQTDIYRIMRPELKNVSDAMVKYYFYHEESKMKEVQRARARYIKYGPRQKTQEERDLARRWRQKNKKKLRDQAKQWRIQNKERWRKYKKTPENKCRRNVRKRLKDVFNGSGVAFSSLLGCTGKQLRAHLESQFKRGMSWDNYGTYWHIDHIQPLASFDLTDPAQRRLACNYNNLQPLPAKENIIKSDKILYPQLHLCFVA
jgi:predicted nucleic acid-binding Zn ribbon protein